MKEEASGLMASVQQWFSDLTQNVRDRSYYQQVRRRGVREAQTIALLRGDEMRRYRNLLDEIEHNRDIIDDDESSVFEREKASGKVAGLIAIRNQVEDATLSVVAQPQRAGAGILDRIRKKPPPSGPPVSPFRAHPSSATSRRRQDAASRADPPAPTRPENPAGD